MQRSLQPGVDQAARWVKQGGYSAITSLSLRGAVQTTAANAHDSQCLDACLRKVGLHTGSRILADKGYCSQRNEALLDSRELGSGMQCKAYRNKPWTRWAK